MDRDLQSGQGDTGTGPETSQYLKYLLTNREFTAPALSAAIASLARSVRRRPVRVLDAGTGAGGALPDLAALVRAADPVAGVVAVDLDARALDLARDQPGLGKAALGRLVELKAADLRDVAAAAAGTGEAFAFVVQPTLLWTGRAASR